MKELTQAHPEQRSTAFRFGTKAQNLDQLYARLESATVLPLEIASVGEWRKDPAAVLVRLRSAFGQSPVIVRSSAPGEDTLGSSNAGAYKSVANIDLGDAEAASAAFEEVITSYHGREKDNLDDYEILVQPMVANVRQSGVVLTRDLEKNSPYFLVNYARNDRTNSVTAGSADDQEVVRIYKGIGSASLDTSLANIVRMARELEQVTSSDAIDIEFAVDARGRTYVLQVRPLARTRILSFARLDHRVAQEVERMKEFVRGKLAPNPHLYGETAILGEMPDWNPAEIIGTHPKPLAHSLYRYLIMKSTWREAREIIGYRNPFPSQLMAIVGGRPYVDVRASFNSFLPRDLPDHLCERLVEYYLDRLREFPELHDKIEFEIVVSCLTFDFEVHALRLRDYDFQESEIQTLRETLRGLTERIVADADGVLVRLENDFEHLGPRRDSVLGATQNVSDLPIVVEQLLDDCIAFGTLPFSVFARCAFIGTAFLRSLVHQDVISIDEYSRYVQSIDTVASEFVADLDACKFGALPLTEFLTRYGHLRPGTYDICTDTYAQRPELYLSVDREPSVDVETPSFTGRPRTMDSSNDVSWELPGRARQRADELLRGFGYSFSLAHLERFIRRSIQLRELVKFEFTKNLSAALDLIAEYGHYHGLSREDLSFLDIRDILSLSNESLGEDHIPHLRSIVDRNRTRSEVSAAINLPDLIFSERDVEVASLQRRRPNFTSGKRVIADAYGLFDLRRLNNPDLLKGKIVLIENADPGYDWLFGKSIAGLITKYGGAASHMAIRCAEFGLPAAIGCGEQIFNELAGAKSILLDCAEQRVEAYAT